MRRTSSLNPASPATCAGADHERGAVTMWMLGMVPAFMVVLTLIVDGGSAIAQKQRLAGLANEAARISVDKVGVSGLRTSGGVSSASSAAACNWVTAQAPEVSCRASGQEFIVSMNYSPPMGGALTGGTVSISARAKARAALGDEQQEGG